MTAIVITRAGPMTTIQDRGRPGLMRYGLSASGPMDGASFQRAGAMLGTAATAAIEFTTAGLDLAVEDGAVNAAVSGGDFRMLVNGSGRPWHSVTRLLSGDVVSIRPGESGNYGYVRFDAEIDVPTVFGSRATNVTAGIGGFEGRTLVAGDRLTLLAVADVPSEPQADTAAPGDEQRIRVVWGIHADRFSAQVRRNFIEGDLAISQRLDRMGVRLGGGEAVFGGSSLLSLVSDVIVPGDIQVLGDGTPIVLMRDHQPTGGYPRIATIITADLDRFAQMRPGTAVAFIPVTVEHAVRIGRGMR